MEYKTDTLDFLQNIAPDDPIHPSNALSDGGVQPHFIPVCDHYCGVEPRMSKSLALQREMARKHGRSVFDVTLDCEDGAPVGKERQHAQQISELLLKDAADDFDITRRVAVRVHPTDHSSFTDDVNTIVKQAGHLLAYIMLPKVDTLQQLDTAIQYIDQAAAGNPAIAQPIPIHCLVESPTAIANAFAIASHPRLESISFGLMDFVSSHNGAIPATAMSVQGQFEHPLVVRAKLAIASACHAFGKTPSHCVVTEFQDTDKLSLAAQKAAQQMGYTRMWSIHPKQIPVIIQALSPSRAELAKARAVIQEAIKAQWAPIAFDGILQDRASYRYYWQLLQRSRL